MIQHHFVKYTYTNTPQCSVLDELGVDATIAGVVDILSALVRKAQNAANAMLETHLVQEAISIWMAEFSGHIATGRLDKYINSENKSTSPGSSAKSTLGQLHDESLEVEQTLS